MASFQAGPEAQDQDLYNFEKMHKWIALSFETGPEDQGSISSVTTANSTVRGHSFLTGPEDQDLQFFIFF